MGNRNTIGDMEVLKWLLSSLLRSSSLRSSLRLHCPQSGLLVTNSMCHRQETLLSRLSALAHSFPKMKLLQVSIQLSQGLFPVGGNIDVCLILLDIKKSMSS